jgi:hypothetical protein
MRFIGRGRGVWFMVDELVRLSMRESEIRRTIKALEVDLLLMEARIKQNSFLEFPSKELTPQEFVNLVIFLRMDVNEKLIKELKHDLENGVRV